MIHRIVQLVVGLLLAGGFVLNSPAESKPLRALLITGGCCHNYPFQTQQLTNAVAKLATVAWTVVMEASDGTKAEIPLYNNPDWAKGFGPVKILSVNWLSI